MKLHTMLIAAGLMCMAPAIYAQTTTTETHDGVHHAEKKDHKKHRMAKGKKVKPLSPKERKEMETREQVTNPPSQTQPEGTDVK